MKRINTDVVIAGAGPAGATTAALLAAKGVDAIAIDKDTFPRDKLCGEFLSWDAVPVLELLNLSKEIEKAGATRIETCSLNVRDRVITFTLPGTARGISRLTLDALLANQATANGARLMTRTSVTRLDTAGERMRIVATRETEEIEIEAALIVGAWGRWGRLDKQLQRSWVKDRKRRYFGFKRHYLQSEPSDEIAMHVFRDGYLGISPIEKGMTNLCGLVHDSRMKEVKDRWDGFVGTLSEEEPLFGATHSTMAPVDESFISSEPVIFRARDPVHDGIIMVGDTAGIVDPLAGNGMAMALQSGLLAATHITRFLAGQTGRENILDDYAGQFRELFIPRIRWSRSVAFLLSRQTFLRRIANPLTASLGRLLAEKTRGRTSDVESLAGRFRKL